MEPDGRKLDNLAGSVSDGGEVSWPEVESTLEDHPDVVSLVSQLEIIARIAAFHRQDSSAETPSEPPGLQKWGHLEILEKVGQGGFGEVYRAWDPTLEREVALKLLLPRGNQARKQKRAILKEGRLLAKIRHPNVATVFGVDEHQGRVGLWIEYIRGKTLADLVRENGPFGAREATGIGIEVCRALAAVHNAGLIHRDIKAENIMREEGGRIVLMDFGLGRRQLASDSSETAALAGTPAYMAPELFRGEAPGKATDIYAMGVLLYHLVTGGFPISGKSLDQMVECHSSGDRRPLTDFRPDLMESFCQVVDRALHEDSANRFASAGLLEQALGSGFDLATPGARQSRPERSGVSTLALAGIALLTALLIFLAQPFHVDSGDDLVMEPGLPLEKHLAILPFADIARNPANRELCDGLVETLTSKMSQLEKFEGNLWVVPHTEIQSSSVRNADQARRTFAVNLAVTGSLQELQGSYRLTLNLIDAIRLRQLASRVLDISGEDVLALQDRVSLELAGLLGLDVQPAAKALLSAGGTSSPGAYPYYLQARGFLLRHDRSENVKSAIELFKKAIEEDREYALAYAGLGEAYWRSYLQNHDAVLVSQAQAASRRALELEPELAWAHITLGMLLDGTGQYEEAIQALEKAIELDPGSGPAYSGLALAYENLGDLEKAESTYLRAISNQPDYWSHYNRLGAFYLEHGEYEKAEKQYGKVIELTPDNYQGYSNLGGLYFYQQRLEEARQMFERSIRAEPNFPAYSNLATLYFWKGRYLEAARLYEEILQEEDADYTVRRNLASSYYWAGLHEKARELFRQVAGELEERLKVNDRDPRLLVDLAAAYGVTGEYNRVPELLERALSLAPNDMDVLITAAEAYEDIGERERALECVREAVEKGYPIETIRINPGFAELRGDNRFKW